LYRSGRNGKQRIAPLSYAYSHSHAESAVSPHPEGLPAMSTPLSITCPHCATRLKLKDTGSVGKKVPCPKCKQPFVVEAPPESEEDEFDFGEEVSEAEEEMDEEPPAPAARKKPAKKSSGGSKAPLIIAGGVVGVLLVAGLGLYAMGVFSGAKDEPPPIAAAQAEPAKPADPAEPVRPTEAEQKPADPVAAAAPAAVPGAFSAPPGASAKLDAKFPSKPAAKEIDLAFLPPDADMLIVLRVADLWQAPLVQSLAKTYLPPEALAAMKESVGLAPEDIESITFAGSASKIVVDTAQAHASAAAGGGPVAVADPASHDAKTLVTIRTKKPVDAMSLKLTRQGVTENEHAGKKYHLVTPTNVLLPVADDKVAVYIASPTLLVLGPETLVQGAIDRGETVAPRPELAFIDANTHLIFAFVPPDRKVLSEALKGGTASGDPRVDEFKQALKDQMTGISFGLRVNGGFLLQGAIGCTDPAGAERIREGVGTMIRESQQALAQAKLPAPVAELANQLVSSLNATSDGNVVRIKAMIPDSAQAQLEALPGQFAGLMMMMAAAQQAQAGGNPAAGVSSLSKGAEGPPKEPISATGVPEGTALTARTRWRQLPSEGDPTPPVLEIDVDLVGGAASGAELYGMFTVDKLATADGQQLVPNETLFSEGPAKEFLKRNREDPQAGHPAGGVRAAFVYNPPTMPLAEITEFAGSLKLRTFAETQTVSIKNIPFRFGKSIDNPEFRKAGLILRVVKEEKMLGLKVAKGDASLIKSVETVDREGRPIESLKLTLGESAKDGKPQYQCESQSRLPRDMGLEVTLLAGIEEYSVAFQFADLLVSPAPAPGELQVATAPATTTPGAMPTEGQPAAPGGGFRGGLKGATALRDKQAVRVTVEQLLTEFASDPQGTEAKYADKTIEIVGRITSVRRENGGRAVILGGNKPGALITCAQFTNDKMVETRAKIGNTVTIRATNAKGSKNFVMLTNCELMED
jgi:predicted Zn finger-like uncharacterized protein